MLQTEQTPAEHLADAARVRAEAMRLHRFYQGKVQISLKAPVRGLDDFGLWYTPGVAEPCLAIARDPAQVFELTNRGNTVAVVSDGTRVLGLGDIGPQAALPVMEGKAMIFKVLGGVDAVPIVLGTKDADELIRTVLVLQPGFGGINLEDLAQPKCFRILDTLRRTSEIPVWHDDQQGTATVTLAALLNALRVVGKKLHDVRIAFVGTGASNVACSRLIFSAGLPPEQAILVDSQGILGRERQDLYRRRSEYVEKWRLCETTNGEGRRGGIPEAMAGADVVIALSRPGPDVLRREWVQTMGREAIVFACANPTPEIWPWEARAGGAAIVATGRSDFPNQVNNSLGFPGIFRGALDAQARTITDGMCLAAARALADRAVEDGLTPDHILPTMDDWQVFAREAAAVAEQARVEGVARRPRTYEQELEDATRTIRRARDTARAMFEAGLIPAVPDGDLPQA